MKMKKDFIRALAVSAVMGALGAVLMFVEFPLPIIPSFVKFDFSELPALITSFAFGPFWGIFVCLIKNLLHLFAGSSGGVGEISNFILGSVFVAIAGIIYRKHKSRKAALIGCLAGSALMAVFSVVSNYFIVYPIYAIMWFENDMTPIVGMYKTILPFSDTLIKSLFIFNLPFTFIKGIADSVICFLIYKKLSPVLKNTK